MEAKYEGESKSEKFKRVASARTNKIIDTIRLLKNCSNLGNYYYTQDEVQKIFYRLEEEIDACKRQFEDSLRKIEKFEL